MSATGGWIYKLKRWRERRRRGRGGLRARPRTPVRGLGERRFLWSLSPANAALERRTPGALPVSPTRSCARPFPAVDRRRPPPRPPARPLPAPQRIDAWTSKLVRPHVRRCRLRCAPHVLKACFRAKCPDQVRNCCAVSLPVSGTGSRLRDLIRMAMTTTLPMYRQTMILNSMLFLHSP